MILMHIKCTNSIIKGIRKNVLVYPLKENTIKRKNVGRDESHSQST